MIEPKVPTDEHERLQALERYRILDTLPEQLYDDLVQLAAHICGVPIALVSLIDADRQWFKAKVGLAASETPRSVSFCGHAVANRAPLIVSDVAADERFHDNPLVTGDPDIRFYAGFPLIHEEGFALGTLCVIDRTPRELSVTQTDMLAALARQVMSQLELRLTSERHRVQRRFFELSIDMLCVAGHDGYFRELSPAFSRVLGYDREYLLAHSFVELVHKDDRARTIAELERLATTDGDTLGFENRFRHRDGGYRWLAWNAAPDGATGRVMAVARDITEARANRAELLAAKHQAELADSAKSQFLANMSHELRTPLNSIIGFTNILLKNKAETLRTQELGHLERVGRNASNLLMLINDILDLSKIESGRSEVHPEAVELADVVAEVVAQLEPQSASGDTTLRVIQPSIVQPIEADPQRLRQILLNLVGNALKFAGGGAVEVRLVCDSAGIAQRVDVVDDGIGLDPSQQDLVFAPFQQADGAASRSHGGTGLGLSISRALARMLDFELCASSIPGRGCTFSLLLQGQAHGPDHQPLPSRRLPASQRPDPLSERS